MRNASAPGNGPDRSFADGNSGCGRNARHQFSTERSKVRVLNGERCFKIVAVEFINDDPGGRVKLGTACFNLGDFDGVCPRVWPTLAIRNRRVVFCLPVPGK